jgi:hypothetical protein
VRGSFGFRNNFSCNFFNGAKTIPLLRGICGCRHWNSRLLGRQNRASE